MTSLETIHSKIVTPNGLPKLVSDWKSKKYKVVFTNGCFDIIHRGHIDYLSKASDLGDVLIVGINSDSSIKKLGKSKARPIQDEQSRLLILASLQFVNAVILFDEDTPINLISTIGPDVLVKGADYDADVTDPKDKKYIAGSDIVKKNNGEVKTVEFLDGFSTTLIEEKIKKIQ